MLDLGLGFGMCFVFWIVLWDLLRILGGVCVLWFEGVEMLGGLRNGLTV